MSIVICESCQRLIDSDDDPECFVELGNMRRLSVIMMLCEPCRWDREDERERMEHETSKAEAIAEAMDGKSEVYRG